MVCIHVVQILYIHPVEVLLEVLLVVTIPKWLLLALVIIDLYQL